MSRVFFTMVFLALFLSGCASNHLTSNTMSSNIFANTWTNEPIQKPQDIEITSPINVKMNDDLWDRIRQGFDIPDPDLEIINRHVQQLQANPVYVNRVLQRSSSYLFYIIEEVEDRNMPSELALLPFVESAFNPKAVSPVKAAGMWQFMPATGKSFNLNQNIFHDERGDIVKSTRAALDYLQKLYDMFGDWQLALAAYNWGEGSISRSIAKNQAANLNTDYFSLKMPNETKNYVPKLLAYKRIIDQPEKYGFKLPKVDNHPYFVSISVDQDIDVDKVIELSEISREQFLALNPSYNKPVILKGFNQDILLPYGKAELFQQNLNKNTTPLASWTVVKVNKTDKVESFATDLGIDADQIRELNNIPKGMKIRTGSTLLIPKQPFHQGDVSNELAKNPMINLEREFVPVPVVMKCHGKKCIPVPSNVANYASKGSGSSKSSKNTQVADKPTPKSVQALKGKETKSKRSAAVKATPASKATSSNTKAPNKNSSSIKSASLRKKTDKGDQ
jgi:membrane-bound lytic murein transglycosylase D